MSKWKVQNFRVKGKACRLEPWLESSWWVSKVRESVKKEIRSLKDETQDCRTFLLRKTDKYFRKDGEKKTKIIGRM
jgi:hypothetical protein